MTREQALPQIEAVKEACRHVVVTTNAIQFEALIEALTGRMRRARDAADWCATVEDATRFRSEVSKLSRIIEATEALRRCVEFAKGLE